MSNYTKTTDFASKDTLNSGDPNKIVRGTEFDTEFNNIATASATKADLNNPSFEGNVSVNGNITVPNNATIDGRDVSADGTKLDTVESNADVTDTANVTAAGAVMDSELTNEAAVKALDQGVATTDSPTFAGATLGAVTYAATDGTDGQVLTTDGAGNATFEALPDSLYLNVTDFGATGDGTDQTTAIQNAINHASTRGIQTIFFPEGHYKYTTLRFYHDQTDNTAFQGTNLFIGDSTNGTDGTATFAFGWYIADASDLTVTVEGVEQTLDTHYTVSGVGSDTGGTVTFTAGNVPQVPSTSTILRDGDGSTLEFFYSGEVVPGATNLSVTVGGVASTDYTVDIGKRLVVFNSGFAPPSGTNNVVITIEKTVKISSNNRDGRFQLRGTGRLAISDLVGLDKNRTRLYGSVLETTGDGIIIDTDQEFSTPVDARNFVAKDLTFIGDNTGYLLKAEKNPGMSLDTCSFKQFNPNGSGIQPRNCWFFTMNQCYVVGQRHIDTFTAVADGSTLEQFTYTFDNPSATSDILVQFNGGALTETTDYTVTMGATKTVTLTATGATKIGAEYTLSGNRTINVQRINTGDGISSQFVGRSFGNFAGLWTITQSLVDSFANGVHWTGGTVTNFSVRDTAVQNCGNYNIYADSGVIQQMLLDNVYFENQKTQGVSFIKGDGTAPPENSATIRNLRMTNCFMLGGGTNPRITGTCIDLDNVDAVDIEGMYVFRVRQSFLNITATKNLQDVPGEVKNSIFLTSADQTKFLDLEPTVYLLTGLLPNTHNCVWPSMNDSFHDTTNNINLFDPTVDEGYLRSFTDAMGSTGISRFSFGDTTIRAFQNADSNLPDYFTGAYELNFGQEYKTYYDLTTNMSAGLAVYLPDAGNAGQYEINDGRLVIVKNNETSTSSLNYPYINVYNRSTLGPGTALAQLAPGQTGLFIFDSQDSEKFKFVGRTFNDRIDLYDNEKLTFGRGTSAAADMEVYHDSTSGESRIDTLAGLTLDGLTYPTADGTSGQVITTDGSGGLSFTNVSGVGINAVVDDTTPQLGGDLASNGNDILFADNDKAIFGAGSDLEILSQGTDALIRNGNATAEMRIESDDRIVISDRGFNEAFAIFNDDDDVKLYHDGSLKLATTSTGIDVTGSINTALSVNSTGPDVKITGATPALEFVESDNSGSRMRMAWATSGSFEPTLYQSLYGDTTSTFGGINIQTRASDGSGNQVVYAYDPIADRNFWNTRGAGNVAMQLQSDGTFNVRGGDVVFENSGATSDDFFWDASTSRLGLGTTSPYRTLTVSGDQVVEGLLEVTAATPQILFSVPSGGLDSRIHNDGSGNFIFGTGTNSATPTERMRITSAGSVDVTGNLTVDAGSNGKIEFGNITTNYGRLYADSTGTFVGSVTADPLIFRTTNTERMRIDASGNVGIGTSSPIHRLSVDSSNRLWNVNDNGASNYVTTSATNTSGSVVFHRQVADRFHFGRAIDGTDDKVVIDSSGNVGIGTQTPTRDLHIVENDDWAQIRLEGNSSGGAEIMMGDSTTESKGRIQYVNASNYMRFDTNATERMRIDSSGVDVTGSVTADSVVSSGHITAGSAYSLLFGDGGERISGNNSSSILTFVTDSAERMRIDSSGNLLVGTTATPNTLLGASATQGVAFNGSSGYLVAAASGQATAYFNRQTSNGDIAIFRISGATVGSIGSFSSDLTVGKAGAGLRFEDGTVSIRPHNVTTNAGNDDAVSLGWTDTRFKDLYLSNTLTLSNATTSSFLQVSSNILQFGTSSADPVVFYVNSSEAARFDASGNLLVGKAANDNTTAGFKVQSSGFFSAVADGTTTCVLNRLTSDGDIAIFRKDGATVGSIATVSGALKISGGSLSGLQFSSQVRPMANGNATDGATDFGRSANRWRNIYATNGTIQTSDRNEKQDIEELSDAEQRVAVACKGLLRKFRWIDSVEEKGDDARIHFGIIAQDLQDAFTAEGLDAGRYGMFINSTWTDEETGEERSRMGVRYSELLAFIISAI